VKKIVAIVIAMLMVMSGAVAGGAVAKETPPEHSVAYKKTLDIVTPEPVIETYQEYHVPRTRGYKFMTEPSVPMLPVKSFSLVIPQTAEIKNIQVVSATKEELRGDYDILPVQEPVPTGINTPVRFTPKNPAIYASSNPYPGTLFEYAGEGNLRDYRILSIFVYPLQYNPAGKKLIFYKNVQIEVTYTAPSTESGEIKRDEFASMVKALVSNPEDVDALPTAATAAASTALPPDAIDYVIITDSTFEAEFRALADWKEAKSVPAEVVNVSWIESNYAGVDTQERIRNFINDARFAWGTKWILLGGDTNVVPHREAYSNFQSENERIPADLYYSDLDGNWDADGDSIYGEVADDIDFYPEVFVGRAPVDTVDEAKAFVNKTIAYEQGPSGYETTALLMAEYLDTFTDGAVTKEMIDNDHIPDYFAVTKLYESGGTLNKENAKNELNKGYGIVNHVGHGNAGGIGTGPDALYRADMDSLNNGPNESVFYSLSCLSNAFEQDSFSEHVVLNPNGGGIAYIGNSRYGWYSPGNPGYGPSDLFDREFFKSLFNENFYHVGETLADSRITFIPASRSGDTVERWIQYSLNLLGDPETRIWTNSIQKPPKLSVTVGAPAKVTNYNTFAVTATITNSGEETATGVNATIRWIPESGLNTSEPRRTSISSIAGGDSETVSWNVSADTEGIYNLTVEASAPNAAPANDTATVAVIGYCDDVANGEETVMGTRTGSYVDTHASDDVYEAITEGESKGNPAKRYSYVEHTWTIDVTGGSSVIFYVEAYRTANEEEEDVVFAYSTDGSTYTDMVKVTSTSDTDTYQTYELPGTLRGTVSIRVMDTDRTEGNRALDTIYVDHLFIRTESGPPSYGATVTIEEASETVKPGECTTYNVSVENTGGLDASYTIEINGTAVDETNIAVSPLDWNTGTLAPGAENVTTVSVSTTSSTPETTYTLTAAATCDQNARVTDSAASDLVVSPATNTMHVHTISMWYTTAGPNYKIYTTVTIVDSHDAGVAGATVYLNTTLPDSTTVSSSGDTADDGATQFMYGPTKTKGNYISTVANAAKDGWTYEPDSNVETCDSITAP
jgi:hypothetical protein